MTIPATYVGATRRPDPKRKTCPRCGIERQVNRGDDTRPCGSCIEVLTDLGELWRWL